MADEYDHDGISIHDLMELGVPVAAIDIGGTETPGTRCVHDYAVQDVEQTVVSTSVVAEFPASGQAAETEPIPGAVDVISLDVFDFDEEDRRAEPDDPLDQLWHSEVPEADDEQVDRELSRPGVSSDERATQLALEFLREEGQYSKRNLDLLADIIRQRGWSGVQTQVRGLVRAGYDIASIHRMFQLTAAWLHCVESDVLAPAHWHNNARLTWLEAAHLLDFLGHDAEFEQISDFLFAEQEVWYRLHRESGHLATFKSYLFQYRLSPRTELDEAGWQYNLDPRDTRSFDGTRNPLYRPCWWDEPTDSGARSVRQTFGAICDPARIAEWLAPDAEKVF